MIVDILEHNNCVHLSLLGIFKRYNLKLINVLAKGIEIITLTDMATKLFSYIK